MRTFDSAAVRNSGIFRRFLALVTSLSLAAFGLVGLAEPASAAVQTFGYTGGPQIYVVPDGVTSISVTLNGAQGGSPAGGGTGGRGATVSATVSVNPGEVLMIMVGGNGTTNGGWNGGGLGAGTGGGASDIRRPSAQFNTVSSCAYTLNCNLNERILVAGGGGGGGLASAGLSGSHGGDAGQSGQAGTAANISAGDATAGGGATPTVGGTAGTGTFSTPGGGGGGGAPGIGANGAWVGGATGGGGGGGYFGGGAGGVSQDPGSTPTIDGVAGGGGGSSWAGGTGVSAATFSTGTTTSDGSVTIDPPSAIPAATFGFTGAAQFYTVPANTSNVYLRIYGAAGGIGTPGDIVYGRLPVTPGQVLQVNIGGRGYNDARFFPGKVDGQGGWNGGGMGYYGPGWFGGGGGGGATDIRFCSNASLANQCALSDRLVVAGGGGGGSYPSWGLHGGHGGFGPNGQGGDGGSGDAGLGGTLTAGGGTQGTGPATAGALGVGGASGQPFYGAGGGGGGLYGGGGGNGSGGGGGSSCASVTGPCTAASNVLGAQNAPIGHSGGFGSQSDGMAVITAMPEATTGAMTNIASTTASVAGTVNAKFLASTPKLFLDTNQATIDSCSSIGSSCTPSGTVLRTASLDTRLAGSLTQAVSGSVTGLSPNTTYYYRVCAQSVAGYSCGATASFTTQLSVTNTALANGTVGQAYTDQLLASGGSGTYTGWALVNSTSLPAGLTLNTQTGAITGTPTAQATGSVDVRVTDSSSGTATKTLAFTISAPAPAPSQNTSVANPSIPLVSNISSRSTTEVGGNSVTVTGLNLGNSRVQLGGISLQLTENTANSFTFVVPRGLTGQLDLTISNAFGSVRMVNAISVGIGSTTPSTPVDPPRQSKVIVFDNFAAGSPRLTATHRSQLVRTARASKGYTTIVCIGYTMGPSVLPTDRALALSRAKNVCNALRRLAPTLNVIESTGVTETGMGGKVRRVEVTFRN